MCGGGGREGGRRVQIGGGGNSGRWGKMLLGRGWEKLEEPLARVWVRGGKRAGRMGKAFPANMTGVGGGVKGGDVV